ncbi:GNAT family N-acetyltransferase [Paenibacillus cisolokensis]|uniref:GNAT family N-acetyltransferase n=1 Tax=Paenibacillus cisolokensis TaxID=1658519 RepID=UPI003D279D8F
MQTIVYRQMTIDDAERLQDIDRSEYIDLIYEMRGGEMCEIAAGHECPAWDADLLDRMRQRYCDELSRGGTAFGAFDGETLAGFGVLAHRFRGPEQDQLQIDLLYVSRGYRRRGIATRIMNELRRTAIGRGAKSLYISSTETRSAVSLYRSIGGRIAERVDPELFEKEPKDIHMIVEL